MIDLRALVSDAGLTAKHLSKDGKFIQWSDNTITSVAKFKENMSGGLIAVDKDGVVTPAEGYTTFVNNQGIRVFSEPNDFDADGITWDEAK
jgi:hypothetical protein